MKSRAVLWTFAVVINLIWAIAYPLSKEVMREFPPMGLATWRMVGGALVLLPLIRRGDFPKRPSARDWIYLVLMGLIGCALSTLLQFIATTHTLASHISLLVALETVFVMIFAQLFLRERGGIQAWGGALIAFAGVALITVNPAEEFSIFSGGTLKGNLIMLLSVACYAAYTIFGKVLAGRWGSGALTALPNLAAAAVMIPLFAWSDPAGFARALHPTPYEWKIIFLVSCLGAGLGFLVWNWLLRFMSAGSVARSLYVQPVAGVLFSAWILGEVITPITLAGGALVLGGIILSERVS